ncbi:hypothetical protein K457DRAFT_1495805 [Linnemannia elongata AG-77]|uniref:Uncharacterized protein n=1 Tax=Linnemannia elongata AG-77 TaxID=1314771 RepID=A0A197KCZ5_9FUNG|nr:hypothetical protein K457DRAFT_1495805 [Linnemannia elongata AG-77]
MLLLMQVIPHSSISFQALIKRSFHSPEKKIAAFFILFSYIFFGGTLNNRRLLSCCLE